MRNPEAYVYWHHKFSPARSCGEKIVRLRVLKISIPLEPDTGHSAGSIVRADAKTGLYVQCGLGIAKIESLRPEGKRTMSGEEFVRGYRPKTGDRFLNYGSM